MQQSYESKALNETMLPMKRKKSITISHTQHGTTPIRNMSIIENKSVNERNVTCLIIANFINVRLYTTSYPHNLVWQRELFKNV